MLKLAGPSATVCGIWNQAAVQLGCKLAASVAGGGGAEGGGGPSLDELSLEYAPPEVIFSSRCAFIVVPLLNVLI
jgi:hypothetical protein